MSAQLVATCDEYYLSHAIDDRSGELFGDVRQRIASGELFLTYRARTHVGFVFWPRASFSP